MMNVHVLIIGIINDRGMLRPEQEKTMKSAVHPPGPVQGGLSRRGFLGATFAAGVLLVAEPSPVTATAATGDVTLTARGISILASVGGRVAIRDGSNVTRSQGSRFQVKDTGAGIQLSTGGTPTLVTLADGTPAIRMDYVMPTTAGATTVYGLFTVSTNRAHLEWHISGPSTLVPDGFLFSRAIAGATEPDRFVPITEWVRDAGGGIPYEDTMGVAHTSTWGELHGMFLLERSKQAWTNSTWIHSPGALQADGTYVSEADFFFSSARPSATASIGTSRELGIEIWTDRNFNIWDAAGETISVTALVANGGPAERNVDLTWWVKDFNGVELTAATVTGVVAAASTWEHTFTMPAPGHGISVAEVAAVSGSDEAFARTTLAVLTPQTYTAGSQSMFGISNYPWLQVPSAAAVLDLWQRVGVDRVRISYVGGPGLPPSAFDERGMSHNIELQPSLVISDAAAAQWATTNVATAIAAGAEYFEVGNELNRPFNTGVAAQAYIDKALRPVVNAVRASGAPLKVLNGGLAGMDKPWVENFIAGGGWELIDGFAYHPGRGNFTPDFDPEGGDWSAGATGLYWNFAGGLRQLNVFLTLAMAKAEGIRCVNWYQFHDSVLGNAQFADPENVEYHFGLMNRDVSAKPSLLAYATAAKTFDQATFLGWLDFDEPGLKGLLFDTPDGEAAVMWSRADGYILNADHDNAGRYFPAPEVWVDPWPTKTPLTVVTSGDSARQVDSIGQSTALTVNARTTTIVLDGAPRIFYGLRITGSTEGGRIGPITVRPRM
jgi:hypothetical protein